MPVPFDYSTDTVLRTVAQDLNRYTVHTFNVAGYGADATGVLDATSAINSALAQITQGTVVLPAGVFSISSNIAVPEGVNIVGAGAGSLAAPTSKFATIIKCTTASAGLSFSTHANPFQSGGISSGFVIDGNKVATSPFYVGSTGRTFIDINVRRPNGEGIRVEGQNNTFISVESRDPLTDALVFDFGAGGNTFFRCEFINAGTSSLIKFTQSGASGSGAPAPFSAAYAQPSANVFYNCIAELIGSSEWGTTGTGGVCVLHEAGFENKFCQSEFADNNRTSAGSMVKVQTNTQPGRSADASSRLHFDTCRWSGVVTLSSAIEIPNDPPADFVAIFQGICNIEVCLNGFKYGASATRPCKMDGEVVYLTVTNRVTGGAAGFTEPSLVPQAGSRGLRVFEGYAAAKQGVATLSAGTVTVSNTTINANSRIFLAGQDNNVTGALRVSARNNGVSFTITSSAAGDTGVVAWEIFDPAT